MRKDIMMGLYCCCCCCCNHDDNGWWLLLSVKTHSLSHILWFHI